MGAEPQTTAPAPEIDNAFLADLMMRQIKLLEEQNAILRNQKSEWIDADTAAKMLGKSVKESGAHLRVLAHCRKKALLSTFGQLRPYTYLRSEVEDVMSKVKGGRLVLP